MTEAEMQALHDIWRAEILICRVRGTDALESGDALDRYAAANHLTMHAAALTILARGPTTREVDPIELRCAASPVDLRGSPVDATPPARRRRAGPVPADGHQPLVVS